MKDWKHPDWNKVNRESSSSSMESNKSSQSDQEEEPDRDFLESAEERPVEGRRLEGTTTKGKNEVSEED